MPFSTAQERALHFQKHGREFKAATEVEYEQMADAFMGQPMTITTRECIRPQGIDRLRFNVANDHFGAAIVASTIIKTFYIVRLGTIKHHGGKTAFFGYECARSEVDV